MINHFVFQLCKVSVFFFVCLFIRSAPAVTLTAETTIVGKPCAFQNEFPQVLMPDVNYDEIVGAARPGLTDVSINLICSMNSKFNNVIVSVTGEPDLTDPTAFKNTGTAEGVALRLVDIENQTLLPSSSIVGTADVPQSGIFIPRTLNMSAYYVAPKGGGVKPGTFNSTALLTLSYD